MYNLIKSVIAVGDYKLTEIQHKIKKLFVLGDITETQLDELLALACAGVSADAERPEIPVLIQNLAAEVDALKSRVAALEGGEEDASEYPQWKPWDGISVDYSCGALVSHNGRLWQSVFNGQNVWEPGASGEGFWVEHQT